MSEQAIPSSPEDGEVTRQIKGGLTRRSALKRSGAAALAASSAGALASPAFAAPRSRGGDDLGVGVGVGVGAG